MPASARLSVRGIGVADSVSTSTSRRSCLSRSLCGDAEALLLVDDDQAEVRNATSFDEQPVRADDDVDACRPRGPSSVAACSLAETNRDSSRTSSGKAAKRCANVAMVLRGEDRRRDEDRDLLAVLDRLERGPQRDLGLAVADVADDQPVHRPAGLHVGLDLGRRRAAGRASPRTGTTPPSRPATACRARTRGPGRRRARRTARAAPRRGRRPPCGRAAWCAATRCRRACESAGRSPPE